MVGCFHRTFKKTYVIGQKQRVSKSSSTPQFKFLQPEPEPSKPLNGDISQFPRIRVVEVPLNEKSDAISSFNKKDKAPLPTVKSLEKPSTNQNGSIPKETRKEPEQIPLVGTKQHQEVSALVEKETKGKKSKAPSKPPTVSVTGVPSSEPDEKEPKPKTPRPKVPTPEVEIYDDVILKPQPTVSPSKYESNVQQSTSNDHVKTPQSTISVTTTEDEPASTSIRAVSGDSGNASEDSIYEDPNNAIVGRKSDQRASQSTIGSNDGIYDSLGRRPRRSGIQALRYDPEDTVKLPVYPKADSDAAQIRSAIEKNDFLNKVISKEAIMDALIDAMYEKKVHANEMIIQQGDKGAHMYISAKGRYQIIIKGKVVGEFSDARVFGELAILYNAPRKASIKALTTGKTWVLDQRIYHQITVGDYIQNQDEIMEFLRRSEKLNVAGEAVLQKIANLLKTEFFPAGKEIVKQGDKGHQFFIIRAGTVTITREGEGIVGVYKKGDCFGELALLKEDRRQATVTADPPGVECLTLTRQEFILHFGEVDFKDARVEDKRDSVQVPRTEHEDIGYQELRIVTTLGVGGFGRVELVQHEKDKNLVFALKYLKKYDIVAQNQQEHVRNERSIQMACRSAFIVRLYRTFKDKKFVFLLMEPCLGGDVWGLLQRQKNRRFEETDARFICACVLEAFEYLHTRGVIYRDLKPENLMIAENGYIKLTDFGFAKKMTTRGKTFTFAGTPEYVAPEIVLNRGHDRAVDYWTFGIFVYEMLRGKTPFRTDDSSHMKTYTKILGGIDNVDFPNIPAKARHLIEKLCRPIPADRLGMQRSGIKQIKEHRWFLGLDWDKFGRCEIPSPFKLKLKCSTDTSLIDKFKRDLDVPPDEMSGWDQEF